MARSPFAQEREDERVEGQHQRLCQTRRTIHLVQFAPESAGASTLIRLAADDGADLALLPETFALQQKINMYDEGEPLDGPVVSTLRQLAREHKMGVAAGHVTLEEGKRFNSLLLIDRRGEIIGIYHKSYPTIRNWSAGSLPATAHWSSIANLVASALPSALTSASASFARLIGIWTST